MISFICCFLPSAPACTIKQLMGLITNHSVVISSQETGSWGKVACQLSKCAHLNSSWRANAVVRPVFSDAVHVSKIILLLFRVKNKTTVLGQDQICCIWHQSLLVNFLFLFFVRASIHTHFKMVSISPQVLLFMTPYGCWFSLQSCQIILHWSLLIKPYLAVEHVLYYVMRCLEWFSIVSLCLY